MRALITGVGGFAGSHLADYLVQHTDCRIWGISRDTDMRRVPPQVEWTNGDLRNRDAVVALLRDLQPDVIFHLAAQAAVPQSWRDPWGTLEVNIHMQVNLLSAMVELGLPARILVIGSEAEYGAVRPDDIPIDEDTPLRPTSPYGVSKVAQDMLGLQYFLSHKIAAIRARPFPHIGPRQRTEFVAADFARQIAEAELGLREPVVRVGNLAAIRDYTDVRDVVRAYWLLTERGEAGEVYNIGSGAPRSVRSLLDGLIAASSIPIRVEVDTARFRPIDMPLTVSDPSRLKAATGWEPQIPFEQTLRDILDDARAAVAEDIAKTKA